ncbi:HAD family hydrolase [Paenarthrobacter nitroguajacolicus]|uniref:HAD family hydrolase n=1 Tax=Paenarthrobacter nitroguajacolicus TaxID=211146 RepID=UPI00248BA170|nr:HAD family hydrolase [Paenarthrobacter nitroguajacolicus]MDI2034893.1 Phosphoglycolate phosphatase [Paenarthrobacter nitroguajacolicus]
MLLLVDLDNTLVDRAAAFNAWASSFIGTLGGSASDMTWLIEADRDGYEPRDSLARAIGERFEDAPDPGTIVQMLLFDHVPLMTMDEGAVTALRDARESGWKIGIVTNGATEQQTLKVRNLGLESYVDAVIISEAVGVKKPDAEIFHLAANSLGESVNMGWMIGDHPTADIVGGRGAGLKTGWISRGETWPEGITAPNLAAPTVAEAINAALTWGPA